MRVCLMRAQASFSGKIRKSLVRLSCQYKLVEQEITMFKSEVQQKSVNDNLFDYSLKIGLIVSVTKF